MYYIFNYLPITLNHQLFSMRLPITNVIRSLMCKTRIENRNLIRNFFFSPVASIGITSIAEFLSQTCKYRILAFHYF